jgi:hypothetical protein
MNFGLRMRRPKRNFNPSQLFWANEELPLPPAKEMAENGLKFQGREGCGF